MQMGGVMLISSFYIPHIRKKFIAFLFLNQIECGFLSLVAHEKYLKNVTMTIFEKFFLLYLSTI